MNFRPDASADLAQVSGVWADTLRGEFLEWKSPARADMRFVFARLRRYRPRPVTGPAPDPSACPRTRCSRSPARLPGGRGRARLGVGAGLGAGLGLALAAGLALGLGSTQALGQPLNDDQGSGKRPAPAGDVRPTPAPSTAAAVESFSDRLIRDIRIVGLSKTDPQLVRNQIRSRTGQPLNPETVRADVQRLNRLGRFREINAKVQGFDDRTVQLTYEFAETPIITAVDIVGNRQVPNSDISPLVDILRDTPVDEFQLGAAKSNIERLYRDKGYFQATVTIDQKELEQSGVVLFRVSEGERVRVTDIRYTGNNAFTERQLSSAVKTVTAGLFETGPVDNEQLDRDVASLISFYRDRGYLDIRADRQVIFSPNGREAIVNFIVDEGPVYTLRSVRVETLGADGLPSGKPPEVLSPAQVAGLMQIKSGDVYSVDKVRKSLDEVKNAYLRMGYVDANVGKAELRDQAQPLVDLLVMVREGRPFTTGLISVKGNNLTQDKVILRELNIRPGRPLDLTTVRTGEKYTTENERRVDETRLFEPGSVKITVQPENPQDPGQRDVLVEVKETNTGSLSFGAGVSSDGGVAGTISLTQRNFDIGDTPDSFGELFSGKAFRGAGQEFNITASPGTKVQTYSISLSDPSVFDSSFSASGTAFYRDRDFDQFTENRLGARAAVGRRFGERWVGNLTFRFDNVNIRDIDTDAPTDLYDVQGRSNIGAIGVRFTRTTVDSRFRPTRGTRINAEIERAGALGGDYNFTRLSIENQAYFPVYESFLGYKTVLSVKVNATYIPEGNGQAPIFERLFLGGSSFRGFDYRTISPKGIRNDTKTLGDDPIGGSWQFFAGAEVQQPVFKDNISLAAFLDSGTVTTKPGFDQYRVSAGVGVRIFVPQLGPVPLAFDFGFPLLKQDGDKRRFFSFSLDIPF